MSPPTAATQVAGVIGDPVRHSLSPRLYNAAFAVTGLDWVYVAFPVAAGRGAEAVAAMRALGLRGLSVTMPHKADVAAAVDRLTPAAARLGGANTVRGEGSALLGDSTDGAGLLAALRVDVGWDPAGRSCLVLGPGGAARAATLALAEAGARSIGVVGRRAEAAAACAALAGPGGRVTTIDAVDAADLVVDATPVGMLGAGEAPAATPAGPEAGALPFALEPRRLGRGQVVMDLVYAPPVTPLLVVARERGATAVNGLGMLVHQAALQFEGWTGVAAPLDAMLEAAATAGGD